MSSSASSASASPRDRWRAILVPFYRQGSATNHFLRRRIRPAGMGLMISGIVVICLVGRRADSVNRLLFLILSLGFLSLLMLPFRRARLAIARELPDHATAGEPVRIRYRVKNLGRLSLQHAWLEETPPDPRPTAARFVSVREPGEENRNLFDRTFSYYRWTWLLDRLQLFDTRPTRRPLDLRPGQTRTYAAEIVPRRRGLVRLHDLRLLLPDALGFFQRRARVKAPEATLAVLPRRYPLPAFELPGSARFQPGGDAASRNTGPSGEFVGLRDYRPGDPLRLVDWKSWARTGKPIVKELEDTFFPRHGLVLDTYPDAVDDDLFEAAVSVAASFVSAADTHESLIDLMFIADRPQVVTAGRGTGRAVTLLEVLAGVEATRDADFDALTRLVLRHAEDLAGCLVVFAGWSDERAELLHRLRGANIEIAALVLSRETPATAPPRVHFLDPARLPEDLQKLPRRL